MVEAREKHGKAQAIEGYACVCGFKTDDGKEIRTHVMLMSAQDGKGTHKSLGRINLQTGEIVLPPWNKRTKEQKRQSTYGKRVREAGTAGTGTAQGGTTQGGTIVPLAKTTDASANPNSNCTLLYPLDRVLSPQG